MPCALLCIARVLLLWLQGRFTLLLGPPGSGKSTLLKALSNKLDRGALQVDGDITYNGHRCAAALHSGSNTACVLSTVQSVRSTVLSTAPFCIRTRMVIHAMWYVC